MKKLNTLLLIPIFFLFIGCSDKSRDNNIEVVKNGVMEFNKSTTVGKAFDNYQHCTETEWREVNTPNGQNLVEFTCVDKNVEPFVQKTIATLDNDIDLNQNFLQLKSLTNIYQWQINKDGSFEISNIDSVWKWVDGKEFSVLVPINEYIQNFETIYKDLKILDTALYEQTEDPALNYSIAMSFYELFIEFYGAAK